MSQEPDRDEMRPEYDFRGGVRGKYYDRYHGFRVQVQDAPWVVQQPLTESAGEHAPQSTRHIGAEPVYQPLPAVVGSDR